MKQGVVFLFITAITFSACTSTKIYPRIKCHICLGKEDGILLLPLNWQESFRKLSVGEQNELEELVVKIFKEEGFTNVAIYDRMEYELLNAGIKDVNDPVQRANINLELGIPYLIGLSLGELAWTGNWERTDPANIHSPSYWDSDTEIKSMLRVALMETATGNVISDYAVETSISEFPIPFGEEQTLDLNFGTLYKAVSVSTRKGIKNLIRDCGC
ncbi:hypothetical protein PBT90_15965 [Algoriphagus halophytocola]|uniref:DUF4136 domain-containing protein n=1 Tax=Algoriphagus halophytocola TaxID=2991499 RepID=A0ABY6MBR3_9BACT|nr:MULTISPECIES: hypothetical protein [unclassified Algoriphagus]UZD21065.1 hypothetical protein OM944_10300 [Algoriphagus sp. TR-M5]WBL42231.1 hypothetical protein PBT90_15965 [Algoriphagus sp. TR-M9]